MVKPDPDKREQLRSAFLETVQKFRDVGLLVIV